MRRSRFLIWRICVFVLGSDLDDKISIPMSNLLCVPEAWKPAERRRHNSEIPKFRFELTVGIFLPQRTAKTRTPHLQKRGCAALTQIWGCRCQFDRFNFVPSIKLVVTSVS